MHGLIDAAGEIFWAWRLWLASFLWDADQLPYRRAVVIAFIVGAVLSWFAAKDWNAGGEKDGRADEP